MEAVTDFIFLGFEITANSDCSHEIKRCLLLGRIAMINLDSVLESRDIILLTKVCIVLFSSSHVQMSELHHKKTECQRTDPLKLCCCKIASVVSDSVRPPRQQTIRLPCPWDSPGKNTGVGCHFLLQCMKVKTEIEVIQSCPTLSDPMSCSPPGSSVHGVFQARVLEWVAIAFSADKPREHIKKQRPYFSDKGLSSRSNGFSSSHE